MLQGTLGKQYLVFSPSVKRKEYWLLERQPTTSATAGKRNDKYPQGQGKVKTVPIAPI